MGCAPDDQNRLTYLSYVEAIPLIHPTRVKVEIGRADPAISLLLLNCPSASTAIDIGNSRVVSRSMSFNVSGSTTGTVTATIPGNDVISCNGLPAGQITVWQMTAYYKRPQPGTGLAVRLPDHRQHLEPVHGRARGPGPGQRNRSRRRSARSGHEGSIKPVQYQVFLSLCAVPTFNENRHLRPQISGKRLLRMGVTVGAAWSSGRFRKNWCAGVLWWVSTAGQDRHVGWRRGRQAATGE